MMLKINQDCSGAPSELGKTHWYRKGEQIPVPSERMSHQLAVLLIKDGRAMLLSGDAEIEKGRLEPEEGSDSDDSAKLEKASGKKQYAADPPMKGNHVNGNDRSRTGRDVKASRPGEQHPSGDQ